MLGGGNFTIQNKVFPGAYINFVSTATAGASMGSRGAVAIPMVFEWGPEREVFEVTAEDLPKKSKEIFGYAMEDTSMLPVRELFKNMTKGIFYRLNAGVHGANDYGTARYSGTRGNSLLTIITKNVDDTSKFDVKTLFDGKEVDFQTVSAAGDLKDNRYVTFKKEASLAETAGQPFTGGTNGADVTGEDYAVFLDKIESSSFQILCCPSADDKVKALFTAFTKRMRDEA